MKSGICLTLCLLLASVFAQPTPSEQTLQLLYNGFFEQAGLSDPTTLISCFDDSSATLTVNFIGTVLQELASYDIFDLDSTVQQFVNALPQSVKDCSNSNSEYQNVQKAYNMSGLTLTQIETTVANYAFTHLAQVHDEADSANTAFKAGTYIEVGKQGGILAQAVFGGGAENNEIKDAQSDLQLMANGYWEQAGLADPTTLNQCFDESSANLTVTFIGALLNDLANNNINAAENDLNTFQNNLPNSTKTCLNSNAEMIQMLQAYNMFGLTTQQITAKIETYALFHLLQLHHDAGIANSDFQAGNFKSVGQEGGSMIQNVFGKNTTAESVGDAQADLQLMANGYWEQAGLADPTTLNQCFDESSANLTVTFIGALLNDLANSNIKAAENDLNTFQNNLPNSTKTCLNSNAEMIQMLQAYNMFGLTTQQITAKIETYALFHLLQLHHDAGIANSDFQAGNFKAVGQEGGSMIQNVFGKNTSSVQVDAYGFNSANYKHLAMLLSQSLAPSDDPIADLTGLFDGFWEQAGLSDPTTPIACYDDPNAQITLTFVATVFSDLANDNLLDLPSAIKSFQNQISPTVMNCLSNDPQIQQVGQAYGITDVSTTTLVAKVAKYAILHAGQFHQTAVQMNTDLTSAQYDAAGKLAGQLLQSIMSSRMHQNA